MSDTSSKIIEIIADQAMLEPSDVTLDNTIEDIGMDSLALVEVVFAIEEQFGISVPFNANEPEKSDFDISSVRSIVDAVDGLMKVQA